MTKDLKEYRRRRDPGRTPEPAGRRRTRRGKAPIFVIQEHKARTRHFDFRLEVDGVLCSWAVPKGPSTDPREKRLAIRTEDHPLDYAEFEGVIAEGEYGAGAVIVWDRGTYDNITEKAGRAKPIDRAFADGHALVRLHGRKIEGGYALQRLSGGDEERWLLVKLQDQGADARRRPTSTEPESVLSGDTVEQVEREAGGSNGA